MRSFPSALLVPALIGLGSMAPHPAPPSSPSPGWLAGCWALRQGDRLVEETWMPERGGIMLGMSRTSVAGRVREHEFVLLETVGGRLEYRVMAGDQPAVVFKAVQPSRHEVQFENPSHDFPKRIGYRLVSADSLEAWIDGGDSGTGKRILYPYHRVGCTGA